MKRVETILKRIIPENFESAKPSVNILRARTECTRVEMILKRLDVQRPMAKRRLAAVDLVRLSANDDLESESRESFAAVSKCFQYSTLCVDMALATELGALLVRGAITFHGRMNAIDRWAWLGQKPPWQSLDERARGVPNAPVNSGFVILGKPGFRF